MKQLISKSSVDAMPEGAIVIDTKIDGFIARRLPSGKVSYGFRYRGKDHKQWWLSLGVHGQSGVTAGTARGQAKAYQGSFADRNDPGAEKPAGSNKTAKAKQT